ncbi:hypothetical protein ABID22_003737 [Pontibacter aydingkolensis]|uniref:Uncharacterized protein n=1 Tax=Pontibacter aydingkolensis TaxID=1911536 RepID=A0ABS7CZ24_9BACT|nr:DUF6334 family protein [Pontibacter aydingkolensis]MBW7469067.1 hypothetical protein [Pontibacter aydingkolensis]
MEAPFKTDNIAGEKIEAIAIEVWDQNNNGLDWVTKVFIQTTKETLVISVNPDLDKLELKTESAINKPIASDKETSIVSVDATAPFSNLLDKRIVWIWTLTNNQGYQDDAQIEVADGQYRKRIQFMAEGSQIKVYRLK